MEESIIMPSGIYERTEKHKETSRQNAMKGIVPFARSEHGRKLAITKGKRNVKFLINFIASKAGKEMVRQNGKKMGKQNAKFLIAYGKTEIGRKLRSQNGKKVIIENRLKLPPTPSQYALSKALLDDGIHNKLEWYFPEIKRIGDIAIPSSKLIIEVDGSSHERGMFCTTEEKKVDDNFKDEQIRSLGWEVIRITNREININLNEVLTNIKRYL